MMNDLIGILPFIKPDCINKEQLAKILDLSGVYTLYQLDELYKYEVLTKEEYIYFLGKLEENQRTQAEYIAGRVLPVAKEGEKFDATLNYYCAICDFV